MQIVIIAKANTKTCSVYDCKYECNLAFLTRKFMVGIKVFGPLLVVLRLLLS